MVVMANKNPTAYAKMTKMQRTKEQKDRQNKGTRMHVNAYAGAKCGAKKRGGGTCGLVAGYGTTHTGIGRCKFHGGSTPNHRASAIKGEAVLLGAPKEINPLDAILWCIRTTAGEIEFYTEQMAALEKRDWLEDTIMGKQMHVFARERGLAQDRLVRYSKVAVDIGLTERAVRLAEQFGNTIARLLHGLLDDLSPYMTQEGKNEIPGLIRKHILIAEQGHPDIIQQQKALST
jgi:hypothetical protein